MKKGSGTRSGLLWEVERLLEECGNELPQILLMENVPQVIGKNNIDDFKEWIRFLERKGYSNYYKLLNAKNFGIPQNRNRCFMVSILGDYYYEFPQTKPLKLKLKDMLEDEDKVDEKYFLKDKQIEDISYWNSYEKPLEQMEKVDKTNISPTLTTRTGAYAAGMILIKNATKKGYLEAKDGDGVDISSRMQTHRGTVQIGTVPTIDTACNQGVVVRGNYMPSDHSASRVVDEEGLAPTVMENHGTVTGVVRRTENYIEFKRKGYLDIDNRLYFEDSVAPTTTTPHCKVQKGLSIRRLTPRECWRLMGFSDEDYDKASKVVSETQLYKQAGNSIVVNVLMAIFKQLL